MKVYINASDVAACIGENRWKSPEDVVRAYWERNNLSRDAVDSKGYTLDSATTEKLVSTQGTSDDRETLAGIRGAALEQTETARRKKHEHTAALDKTLHDLAVARGDCETLPSGAKEECLGAIKQRENEAAALTKARLDALDDKLEAIGENRVISEALVNKNVVERVMEKAVTAVTGSAATSREKEGMDVLAKIVPQDDLRVISEVTKTHVNTQRGTRGEDTIINDYEHSSGSKVTQRNDKLYYLEVGGILVGGRIDGFVQKSRTLLEVKRRRNRFLGFPKYEKIQCEMYLHMLGIDTCTHVEEFDGQQKSREYTSNPALWETITSGLGEFRTFYIDTYSLQYEK